MTKTKPVSILILGAGWSSTLLIPILEKESISHSATTTTGRDGTIKFIFDPDCDSSEAYEALPFAQTILITFPLKGSGQSTLLQHHYRNTHPSTSPHYIQLGSSGIFNIPMQPTWVTRHSAYDTTNERAIAEDELLALGGCVLNLAGLWGGTRQPRNWIARVAPTKGQLGGKTSLHMIHGEDVARAIVAVSQDFTPGERWLLTDLCVYDWWDLVLRWAHDDLKDGPCRKWVRELMLEEHIRALPRDGERLGRCYDTRDFWTRFELVPTRAGLVE